MSLNFQLGFHRCASPAVGLRLILSFRQFPALALFSFWSACIIGVPFLLSDHTRLLSVVPCDFELDGLSPCVQLSLDISKFVMAALVRSPGNPKS